MITVRRRSKILMYVVLNSLYIISFVAVFIQSADYVNMFYTYISSRCDSLG